MEEYLKNQDYNLANALSTMEIKIFPDASAPLDNLKKIQGESSIKDVKVLLHNTINNQYQSKLESGVQTWFIDQHIKTGEEKQQQGYSINHKLPRLSGEQSTRYNPIFALHVKSQIPMGDGTFREGAHPDMIDMHGNLEEAYKKDSLPLQQGFITFGNDTVRNILLKTREEAGLNVPSLESFFQTEQEVKDAYKNLIKNKGPDGAA